MDVTNKNCNSLWKGQFAVKKFWLNYEGAGDFHRAQWGKLVLPYAIYRTVIFCYVLAVQIFAPIYFKLGEKFLIFHTYWCFMALTIGLFVSAVNAWIYYAYQHDIDERLDISWYVKTQWFVANIYRANAFAVSIVFWALIFDPKKSVLVFANFNTHAINTMIVVLDLFVSRAPVRFLHFWQPAAYFLTYAIFTIIYWQAGGTNDEGQPYIYKIIDYDNNLVTGLGLILGTGIAAVPLLHVLVFCIYAIRQAIWWRCSKREQDDLEDAVPMN